MQFTDSGEPAVLVNLKDGGLVAYSAVCTHQGCTVSYEKDSGKLVCPCHGSVFDPAKGGRALQRSLPEIPVEAQGGKIVKA